MVNKILKELDDMIKLQEKEIELDMQVEEAEGKIHFETTKLLVYNEVARMIKKCAQETATSKGTDINSLSQKNYNTDSDKSEIRRLAMEFIDLCFEYSDKLFKVSSAVKFPSIHLELNFDSNFNMDVSTHTASIFEPIFNFKEYIYSDNEVDDPEEGITEIDSIGILKDLKKKLTKALKEIGEQ